MNVSTLVGMHRNGNRMKLYIDLDGVLCDLAKAIGDLTDVKIKPGVFTHLGTDVWNKINDAGSDFWAQLDWMPDGRDLWNEIKGHDIIILSSPSRHNSSRVGKKEWVARELGDDVPVILETRKEKYASPESVLIDDMKKNIDAWEKAGGKGILHRNTAETLKKLRKIAGAEKTAYKIERMKYPKDPLKRILVEKLRGGRGTQIMTDKTKYDRNKGKDWREHHACMRVVLAYMDDFKFRTHPVVIDPYDAIVQQAIRQMGSASSDIDVVKLETTCPGGRVAWVSNEDFFQGKKDKKRVVHLCLNKIKEQFKKAHGKQFSMSSAEDSRRMGELVVSYLRDVVLPHEGEHIKQEIKGKGQFGASPEVGAERAEDWSKVEQMGFTRKSAGAFFPEGYDPQTGTWEGGRKPTTHSGRPERREAPFSFKRISTQNLNKTRRALLDMKDPKATKIWEYIETGIQGGYDPGQEDELRRLILDEARDHSLAAAELVSDLFKNKPVDTRSLSPMYRNISRKLASSVVAAYLSSLGQEED